MTRSWLGFVACTVAASAAAAPAILPHTSDDITIDGVMDEAAWQQAVKIKIDIETRPGDNIPARVATVAYLLENGESLYVAFDARDSEPEKIRAYLRDRDTAWDDDFVGIILDTYNDERRAFEFFSNALGVQMDATNDDVNQREDSSWDAIWDSAGKIGELGYIVEMEIPLNQLRFPNSEGKQTWGIDLVRFYPRDSRFRFGNNRQDRSVSCYLCDLATVEGLENAKPGRDLEIVPTVTSSKTDSTDDPGVTPLQSGDTETEAGLSVRWGITPDMTANLTINPDFSQVEADVAQLDINNQFALFYPERRPFFLEGADYFTTPLLAVYTRTVADPDYGAKITGKRGKNTFGAYFTQDAITNFLFPGAFESNITSLGQENTAFVGRYNRSFGDASNVGALLTTREGDGYHNYVAGADARWKINDQHSVNLQYLGSETKSPNQVAIDFEQPLSDFSGDALMATYIYSSSNWSVYAEHQDRDAGFRADAGFIDQVDVNWQAIEVVRTWYGSDESRWTSMDISGLGYITHDGSGRMIDRKSKFRIGANGPMQSRINVGYESGDFLWDDQLYAIDELVLYTELQPKGGLRLGILAGFGSQIDFENSRLADQIRIEPFVNWNINRHLLLRLKAKLLELDTQQGAQIFDAGVYDLRLTWQFSRRSFLRLTAQYTDIEQNADEYVFDVDANTRFMGRELLFSYKINPQTVFFLGYSDNFFEDDDLLKLEETDRTWFMKIGYAWTP